jgi:cobalt/nickel transport system permease protein
MRFESLERHGEGGNSPLHRLDSRVKLVATVAFVVGVVATPAGAWQILAAEGLVLAFAIGLSGVPPRDLIRRWLGFLVLVGFLAAMVAPGHPERERLGVVVVALAIVAKNSLAFLSMMVLVHVTPFRVLLAAMGRLGLPPLIVSTLQFMERQIHILIDELGRMVQARRSRSFRRSGRLDYGLLTGLIGMLFLRSFERGERVHAAMLARGWNGTVRTLDGADEP